MLSVNLSKSAVFLRRMEILGLMALGFFSSMFSSLILSMTAYPFLERICANLKTREMHSPIPSICTLPCFLMISFERNRPWFSLLALRTLYTLVSLNFDCCYMWWINQRINISTQTHIFLSHQLRICFCSEDPPRRLSPCCPESECRRIFFLPKAVFSN